MRASTVEVLMDIMEEQENAIHAIVVHLSVGQDLSPPQLQAMEQLKQRFEDTRECLEEMIEGCKTSDDFAKAG